MMGGYPTGSGGSSLPDPVTILHGGSGATSAATARTALGVGLTLQSATVHVVESDFNGLAAGVKATNVAFVTLPAGALFQQLNVTLDAAFDSGGLHPVITASVGPAGSPTLLWSATSVGFGATLNGPQTVNIDPLQDLSAIVLIVRFASVVTDLKDYDNGDVTVTLYFLSP